MARSRITWEGDEPLGVHVQGDLDMFIVVGKPACCGEHDYLGRETGLCKMEKES